jgi:hypothetical protein
MKDFVERTASGVTVDCADQLPFAVLEYGQPLFVLVLAGLIMGLALLAPAILDAAWRGCRDLYRQCAVEVHGCQRCRSLRCEAGDRVGADSRLNMGRKASRRGAAIGLIHRQGAPLARGCGTGGDRGEDTASPGDRAMR